MVSKVNAIKPDLPDQTASLDDPCIVVLEQLLHPALRSLLSQGTQVGKTSSVHTMYLGISSEPKARLDVGRARPSQRDTLTLQHRQLKCIHGRSLILRSQSAIVGVTNGSGPLLWDDSRDCCRPANLAIDRFHAAPARDRERVESSTLESSPPHAAPAISLRRFAETTGSTATLPGAS